jgi:hypothetical protein
MSVIDQTDEEDVLLEKMYIDLTELPQEFQDLVNYCIGADGYGTTEPVMLIDGVCVAVRVNKEK